MSYDRPPPDRSGSLRGRPSDGRPFSHSRGSYNGSVERRYADYGPRKEYERRDNFRKEYPKELELRRDSDPRKEYSKSENRWEESRSNSRNELRREQDRKDDTRDDESRKELDQRRDRSRPLEDNDDPWVSILQIRDPKAISLLNARYKELERINREIETLQADKQRLTSQIVTFDNYAKRDALNVLMTNEKLTEFTYL